MSRTKARKLPREFYARQNVLTVARELLGKLLVVPANNGSRVSGMIVETEAYCGPEDRASHAYGGRRTKRTETMYQLGGTVYVYFVFCIAMGIDRKLDREDLLGERVWIEEFARIPPTRIGTGPRVGIDYAEEWIEKPWRFWLKDNPFVSKK